MSLYFKWNTCGSLLLLVVLLVLDSCADSETCKKKPYVPVQRTPVNYSPVKDIPLNSRKDDLCVFYYLFSEEANLIGIGTIDNGFDSLRIRIWYPQRRICRVVDISKYPGGWKAEAYYYGTVLNPRTGYDSLVTLERCEPEPKSGWPEFQARLIRSGILDLPDMESFAGNMGLGADGDAYSVEIATTKKYRFYAYHNPYDFLNVEKVKRFTDIIDFVNKEFQFKEVY